MERNSDFYAKAGMRALMRAAAKVVKKAREENRPLPYWKDNRVVYEIPEEIPQSEIDKYSE